MFETYMCDMYKNENELYKLLVEDIASVVENDADFKESLFVEYAPEIKMLLQSNQSLFYRLLEYFEHFCEEQKSEDSMMQTLHKDGIYVIESYFSTEEVATLLEDWKLSMQKLPPVTPEMQEKMLSNRFVFEKREGFSFALGSEFDAKKRLLYGKNDTLPSSFEKLLKKNSLFNETVQNYYKLKNEFEPNVVMAEHLFTPKYHRANEGWHIDNLSDQFKIMVVLEDMSEDDAPFTYVEGSHRLKEEYKDRYHKMYATNGMVTQEQNHFEDSFVQRDLAKSGVLKAGSVVLFDCRIHHTATFAKNGGERKNMMLYYVSVPTPKNRFLFAIDKYLNFGLR